MTDPGTLHLQSLNLFPMNSPACGMSGKVASPESRRQLRGKDILEEAGQAHWTRGPGRKAPLTG